MSNVNEIRKGRREVEKRRWRSRTGGYSFPLMFPNYHIWALMILSERWKERLKRDQGGWGGGRRERKEKGEKRHKEETPLLSLTHRTESWGWNIIPPCFHFMQSNMRWIQTLIHQFKADIFNYLSLYLHYYCCQSCRLSWTSWRLIIECFLWLFSSPIPPLLR